MYISGLITLCNQWLVPLQDLSKIVVPIQLCTSRNLDNDTCRFWVTGQYFTFFVSSEMNLLFQRFFV